MSISNESVAPGLKRCCKCGAIKPLSDFNNASEQKDGKRRDCKECIRAYAARNKEAIKTRMSQYYKDNKEHILDTKKKKWARDNLQKQDKLDWVKG